MLYAGCRPLRRCYRHYSWKTLDCPWEEPVVIDDQATVQPINTVLCVLIYFFYVGKLTVPSGGLPHRTLSDLSPEVLSRWQQYSSVSSMQEMRKAVFIPYMSSRNPPSPLTARLSPRTNWQLATASTNSIRTSFNWCKR